MKRGVIIGALLSCVLAFGLVGCSSGGSNGTGNEGGDSSSTSETTAEPKDTFTYAVTDDPGNTLNFFTADDRVSMSFVKAIDEPLFSLSPDGSYNWYVAQSFDSDDGLTYVCKLNSNAKWSDGQPVTADDVVFTFDSYKGLGTDDSFDNCTITKVDDQTVTFDITEPSAAFPETVSNVFLMPKHIFDGKTSFDYDMTSDTIVGCGPYKFAGYQSGSYIKAEANENYVNGKANIQNIVFQIITDDNTAKSALQNGEVDAWIATASTLSGLDNFTVTPYSEGRVAYLRLNRVSPNMQDDSYRKGILEALNRQEIMEAAYTSDDYFTLSYSFLPSTNGYYTDNVEKYDQNINEAEQLVAGGATSLKLCYIGTDTAQTAQAQVIQAELKAIGIDVELDGLEQSAYIDTAYDNTDTTYDMYLGGYIMTTDPDGFKGMFGTGQMINYADDTLDSLFAQGCTELDKSQRKQTYTQAQQEVADQALFYPFGTNLRILVTNPNLQGINDAQLVPIFTFEDMSKLSFK